MTFEEKLDRAIALLERKRRVSYRALALELQLDADELDALKTELIEVHRLAVDRDGKMLVATGDASTPSTMPPAPPEAPVGARSSVTPASDRRPSFEAERRQLTVMFCDLVESTRLAAELDPEDLRDVVRAYQRTCAAVIERFDGHIAQLLGDGLLVYYGWPRAYEDGPQRAIRSGLDVLDSLSALNARLERLYGVRVAVRCGIHTGLVVVGPMGSGGHEEQLALGETPNVAARIQGLAAPDTVVISESTRRLVGASFAVEDLGVPELKGITKPLRLYRVVGDAGTESRFEVATLGRLTPLIDRQEDIALLRSRWEQARTGQGQVVLLVGEPGIGKSRVVEAVRERLREEPHQVLRYHCSPYHRQSALYPVIKQLEQAARLSSDDAPAQKLDKLRALLAPATDRVAEVLPLFAALLSVPVGDGHATPSASPRRQKEQTIEALLEQVEGLSRLQPVLITFEDAQWADPTTLDVLDLVVERIRHRRVFALITARPEFVSPWEVGGHVAALSLDRLTRPDCAAFFDSLTGGTELPGPVFEQLLAKSGGVPLFMEELTKTVLESGMLVKLGEDFGLAGPVPPLAIPSTLQDSLMARLDRLGGPREVAQVAAVLGREFPYEMLRAVASTDEVTLQHDVRALVNAEVLYQRGAPPHAHYVFKHALIQDAAYGTLLRSSRQQLHARIARVIEAQFPDLCEAEPEILAHHYTQAGLVEPAVEYWHKAGQKAMQRSANREAVSHLRMGLEMIATLPVSPGRIQRELQLHIDLGGPLSLLKGFASPDVEQLYTRARQLCQQSSVSPEQLPLVWGLWRFYTAKGDLRVAHELAEQCFSVAQSGHDGARLIEAHRALGITGYHLGDLVAARQHFEKCSSIYEPGQHASLAYLHGDDPGVGALARVAHVLWMLGYPDEALRRNEAALRLARTVAHLPSLAYAEVFGVILHQMRRDPGRVRERAETAIKLSTEHGFALWVTVGTILFGWARAATGEDSIADIRRGIEGFRALGTELYVSYYLSLLAEAYQMLGRPADALRALDEAMAVADRTGEHFYMAELHRLTADVLWRHDPAAAPEAEARLEEALAIARRQQARSWELRSAMSLGRLWQRQGQGDRERPLLAEIYARFTEGFESPDLRAAATRLGAREDNGGHSS